MEKVNIHEKLKLIQDQWNPRVVGELNGQQIRLVKIQGNDFQLHSHPNEEEMFFIVKGSIDLEFEDSKVTLNEGEFYIVPRGVMHRPTTQDEAQLMMFVTDSNVNTGNISNDYTLDTTNLEKL